jgi:uncharacterized MAPEG superfamily protein
MDSIVQSPSELATANNPATPAFAFLLTNFFLAYFILTPRFYRMLLGMATNTSPRTDLANYGDDMVAEEKVTRDQLDRLERWEAAQQNAIENYPLFIAAVVSNFQCVSKSQISAVYLPIVLLG